MFPNIFRFKSGNKTLQNEHDGFAIFYIVR